MTDYKTLNFKYLLKHISQVVLFQKNINDSTVVFLTARILEYSDQDTQQSWNE